MSGTFASFNTALSGIRHQQVALDVASSNIANVTTDGYVRRRVVGETAGAPTAPALWSRGAEYGSGVRTVGLDRMVDPLLDRRVRAEHGHQASLDHQAQVLARVETGLAEPGDSGLAAALAGFRTSLHDLANAPGSEAARGQVLANAGTVADTIRLQARQLSAEQADQRSVLLATVDEANRVAADLAATNHNIVAATAGGADAATLLDARDRLALRLSELTGAAGTIQADGTMSMTLGSGPDAVGLVDGAEVGRLRIATGVSDTGAADGAPITFAVAPADGSTEVSVGPPMGGTAGAVVDLVDRVLPSYADGLEQVAKAFADQVNAQHRLGFDQAGDPGGDLFSYDPDDVLGTLAVAIEDPALVAASGVGGPGGDRDAANALAMADTKDVENRYQRLVSGFGTQVASVQRLASNQQTLTTQVDNARQQLAGVNLDEETVSMVTAQRAYEAAARVMTVLDSVLDTLVNRTGLVR